MDAVRRFLFEALDIRGALVSLGHCWHEMHADRDDPSIVTALFGELAAVAVLIAGNLKTAGRLSIQLQGHGPISLLFVACDEQLRLRGTVRHTVGAGQTASLQELLGDGELILTLQTNTGRPYQSIVPIHGDNLAAVFEHYLTQSEQQPARLFLTAREDFAGGLFLQKLPGADEKDPDGWNRLRHLAATLDPRELSQPAANLLMKLFPEEDIRLFDPRPVSYHCPRDEEKVLAMLKALGRAEVEAALAEQGGELVIEDEVCRQRYRFGAEILRRLFD
ncbi:MAG: Hsp33 family molecular chaperone HslO [Rhodocyclaceae bacterium]|nr:Hsp33 family molecular chaperone HslO [Rhodocyclaceae bacterium]